MRLVLVSRGLWHAAFAVCSFAALAANAEARKTFGIADEIQTARFQTDKRDEAVFISPNRRRYVSMLIRGDVARDGVWAEILVGGLTSLREAQPKIIARLFTHGLGTSDGMGTSYGAAGLLRQGQNVPVWLDNERIALLWEAPGERNQVFIINVTSGSIVQLTHETGEIVTFVAGSQGSLIYDARVDYPMAASRELVKNGYVIRSPDVAAVLNGVADGGSAFDAGMCKRVAVTNRGGTIAIKEVHAEGIYCELSFLKLELAKGGRLISPDGTMAIVDTGVRQAPADWGVYQGGLPQALERAALNTHAVNARRIHRLSLVKLETGEARALWAAPGDPTFYSPPQVAWSPDSRVVMIAPTMLPPDTVDNAGLTGDAAAIIDVESGQYQVLPMTRTDARHLRSASWTSSSRIKIQLQDGGEQGFVRVNGAWKLEARAPVHGVPIADSVDKVQVRLKQQLNIPPALYAYEGRSGRGRIVLDPNPELATQFALGAVSFISWKNVDGREWLGRLYSPVNLSPNQRYPLVIQTHGYADKDEFSLTGLGGVDGGALGPVWSVYLAQVLASRGIAVLQVGGALAGPRPPNEQTQIQRVEQGAAGIQAAAEHLVEIGLVDRSRVGLMGFSATGRTIEEALVHSEFPYAAAIADDNSDDNYVPACLYGWDIQVGTPLPFGEGLKAWLEHSPAFSVERIRTPLQFLVHSPSNTNLTVLWPWEMFSRLQYLGKPVELYVAPDIEHGSHLDQNPRQQLGLQTRALDWWMFWLKNEQDSDEQKVEQYTEWRALREKYARELQVTRPARLIWSASPVTLTRP